MNPPVEIDGYIYYESYYYACWLLISPITGFHRGLKSEAHALSIIRREQSSTNSLAAKDRQLKREA